MKSHPYTICGWIYYFVLLQLATSNDSPRPCLHAACTCERVRLACNPYHLVDGSLAELQEVPTILRDLSFPNIEEADFRYNRIDHIGPNAFRGLHTMKELWLSHNHISTISTSAFNHAISLQTIDLSFNELGVLKAGGFVSRPPLAHIKTINLSNNRIRVLERGCFRYVPHLKQLYVHYNPLTHLDGLSFAYLSHLNTLSLAHTMQLDSGELVTVLEPLPTLRLLFLADIIRSCSCDWLDVLETLKARGRNIMDEALVRAPCSHTWAQQCAGAPPIDNAFTHHDSQSMMRAHNLTSDDLRPPVVTGNDTLEFPDGITYRLDSIEGRRALYQYDREIQEKIAKVAEDKQRKSFQNLFRERMTNFIRTHFALNSSETGTAETFKLSKSPSENRTSNGSTGEQPGNSSSASSKSSKKTSTSRKRKQGMPTSFLWLILGGVGCGVLVACCVAVKHIECREQALIEPEKKKKKKKEKKGCSGCFKAITEKLSIRKKYMKGTGDRKHAKQSFARSSFVSMHNKAKEKMDKVQEQRESPEKFDRYTLPTNHVVEQVQPRPSLSGHSQPGRKSTNQRLPPAPPPPPPTGLRRTSIDDGIRRMVSYQRHMATGGQSSHSSGIFGKFYSDSDDDDEDDVDEETDLFRR